MKVKKKLLILIAIIMVMIVALFQNLTYAATASAGNEMYLGIVPLRTRSTPSLGYGIKDPDNGGHSIWNIVRFQDATSTSIINPELSIYCLKPEVGFTASTINGVKRSGAYKYYYDMMDERSEVSGKLVSASHYNEILAVLDMMYIPKEMTEAEKNSLLESAGIDVESQKYLLTVDEIEAVQQAALWYFTNYGEEKYDKYSDDAWFWYTEDGNSYTSLSAYRDGTETGASSAGSFRQTQANLLYRYLIDTATANASKYASGTTGSSPVTNNTTALNSTTSGTNYILGPINLTKNNDTSFEIELSVKNQAGTAISGYKLLNENKQEVTTGTTVKNFVDQGKNFYISVPKDGVDSVTISMNVKYKTTKMTAWTGEASANEQTVVIVEKEEKQIPITLTNTPKSFDLALRKYITKVNGTELTNTNSRVPSVDVSTLTSGRTATYKHQKTPVIIESGNTVTYKITVYNEGEKAGRATKIVDQLPTGLTSNLVTGSKITSTKGNEYIVQYDASTNKITFTTTGTNNLNAFNGTTLDSDTIEFDCTVTATPDSKNQKTLTNIAWISEEIDSDGNVITNQTGLDRDSEPSTAPNYNKDNMSDYKGDSNNKTDLSDSTYYYKGQQDDDDFEKLVLLPKAFDLKLIKRITAVNGTVVPERIQKIDVSKLNTLDSNGNLITTGDYTLTKNPVGVKKGDLVKYTFRIYNEGDIDGYASEITEDIPDGLQFVWSDEEDLSKTNLSAEEKAAVEFNRDMLWTYKDTTLKTIATDYLSKANEKSLGENLIKAFGKNDGTKTEADISYKEVSVILKVVSDDVAGTTIRNEAAISKDTDANGNEVDDRDSKTDEWKEHPNHEDDEDHDYITLQSFDLALRKFIIAVSGDTTIDETDYLKNADGSYTRAPAVDTSKLNTKDENGKLITTATYNHSKEPVEIQKGDIVIYMLRVYNEGDIDGYAGEIKDHLPSYLTFVKGDFNTNYGWGVSEDGRTVTTKYLENQLVSKTTTNAIGKIVLSYKEVPIMCKVSDNAKTGEAITNIADITKYLDDKKQPVSDRDSQENNVVLPSDDKLPTYNDDKTGNYIPGQQDDDDFEKVIIKKFDLALRKFITAVNDKEITSRVPQVKYEDGKIKYEHSKDPVDVVTNDVVTYTIRVFNEGEVAGYAAEITDDMPDGLEFLPDNEINKTYRWIMIDKDEKETDDVSKAVKITTDYLSKEQEKETNGNLLNAFDSSKAIGDKNPDYKDVKVAFKVVEPNGSDKILVNSAQISEDTDKNGDPVDDIDSIPDKWNDGEDDQDREYVKLTYFDLSLRKWVTQAIVIENGKQTVTQTGHKPEDDPEQIVKVELHRKKINNVTVKFKYSIRVTNEGDIAGYAKEITDYVPEGLKFVAADNKGWTDEGNNVISTRLLENTLLQPGEHADVEVTLTWINGSNNMGLKTNTAEISEDYNDKNVPDRDSTPDNKKPGEDDIDDAPVMLSVSTGRMKIYFTLGFTILITLAGGIFLIKKYVL